MGNQAKGRTIFNNDRGVSRFGQGAKMNNIRFKNEVGPGNGCGGCSACASTIPTLCTPPSTTCGCGSANKVKFNA